MQFPLTPDGPAIFMRPYIGVAMPYCFIDVENAYFELPGGVSGWVYSCSVPVRQRKYFSESNLWPRKELSYEEFCDLGARVKRKEFANWTIRFHYTLFERVDPLVRHFAVQQSALGFCLRSKGAYVKNKV